LKYGGFEKGETTQMMMLMAMVRLGLKIPEIQDLL